jgi:hypothetical protein
MSVLIPEDILRSAKMTENELKLEIRTNPTLAIARSQLIVSTWTELITYWLFTNSLQVLDFSPDFCVINFVRLLINNKFK